MATRVLRAHFITGNSSWPGTAQNLGRQAHTHLSHLHVRGGAAQHTLYLKRVMSEIAAVSLPGGNWVIHSR
jgi:hypothetical protein